MKYRMGTRSEDRRVCGHDPLREETDPSQSWSFTAFTLPSFFCPKPLFFFQFTEKRGSAVH